MPPRLNLRQKYRFANGRVKTAEQFIENIATGSSMTGRPYLVDCPGNKVQESGPWLTKELQRFRAETK